MSLVCMVMWVVACASLAAALGAASIEDLARRVIPNGCVAVVAASAVVAAAVRAMACGNAAGVAFGALSGALATSAVMIAAALASWRARGTPGVGGGDLKLLSAVGLWLGPVWGLVAVALSCATSLALWGAWRLARRAALGTASGTGQGVPLAPGVAATTLGIVLLGLPW